MSAWFEQTSNDTNNDSISGTQPDEDVEKPNEGHGGHTSIRCIHVL